MTPIQEICTDMLTSQEQLQHIYQIRRVGLVMGSPVSQSAAYASAVIAHNNHLASCGTAIMQHAAANDEATVPGAA